MEHLRGGRSAGGLAGSDGGLDTRVLRLRGRSRARGRGRAAPQLRRTGKGERGIGPCTRGSRPQRRRGAQGTRESVQGGGHPESLPQMPASTTATFLSGPSPRRGPCGRVPRSQKPPNKRSKVRAAGCGGRGGGGERVERTKGLLREARGLVPGRLPGWWGPASQPRHHRSLGRTPFPVGREESVEGKWPRSRHPPPPPSPGGSRPLPLPPCALRAGR